MCNCWNILCGCGCKLAFCLTTLHSYKYVLACIVFMSFLSFCFIGCVSGCQSSADIHRRVPEIDSCDFIIQDLTVDAVQSKKVCHFQQQKRRPKDMHGCRRVPNLQFSCL